MPRKPAASPKPRRRWRRWLAWLLLTPLLLSILLVLLLRFLAPPISGVMAERIIEARRAGDEGFRIARRWCPLEEFGPYLPLAVIASEDQRFLDHMGFDTVEIGKALDAAEGGGRLRGASTISQQVAKNLFLWSGRSWLRKGLEVWFTGLMELSWPKRRLLETYLNIAETGDGIFGFCAACEIRFGKPCNALAPYQLALMVATLPDPRRRRADHPTPYLHQRASWIVRQMQQLGGPALLQRLEE
ncbi:MAG: monofunctional biosynthetic peptidoglycan transglycosylase [Xanthomonadales bacterium PRO6]|nr:Biosynthetic peptidoglycan transglycosylase [Xanthomonadales bacterium]MCE7930020.1 monofunctional biosynthetic peptidoglycan transglycosylase [Xanthomonadales bacterium PRO6]